MNFEFLGIFLQLILALGVTLGLMFLSFKLIGTKLNNVNNKKFIKVIERVQITKENSILIVKIGEKGYVVTSTSGHMEKLSELSEEEINIIEENKQNVSQEITDNYNKLMLNLKKGFYNVVKNIRSKEEKHEKE